MSRLAERAEISTADKGRNNSGEWDPVTILQQYHDLASSAEDGYKNRVMQDVTALEVFFKILSNDLQGIRGADDPVLKSVEDALQSLKTDTYSLHYQLQNLKITIGRGKRRLSRYSRNLQIVSNDNPDASEKRSFQIVEPDSETGRALDILRAS